MAGNYFVDCSSTFYGMLSAITFLIYFDISLNFEIKRKKGKKEKKFDMRPPGIESEPTDLKSDVLTTLPSMHMTCEQAQNAWEKQK